MPKKQKDVIQLKDLPEDSDDDSEEVMNISDAKDYAMVNALYSNKIKKKQQKTFMNLVMYATLLFLGLSIPFMDKIIETAFPISDSWLVLLVLKTGFFFVGMYMIVYNNK